MGPGAGSVGLSTLLPSGPMRHVIWDWNGTLVDDLDIVVDAVNVSLDELGADPIDVDVYRDHYTRPVRLFYGRLLGRAVSDEEWLLIDRTFRASYSDRLRSVELTHDALAAIAAVTAAGATQSILSMSWQDDLLPEVKRHGLDRAMIRIDGNTSEAGETKAGLLETHLSHLPNGTRAVLIGDATDDGHAANAIGIPVVLYDGGSHHREMLQSLGVPIAGTLTEAVTIGLGVC
jgi:phosphoglycolate phosphatase-like HAD superfamily hydrolase